MHGCSRLCTRYLLQRHMGMLSKTYRPDVWRSSPGDQHRGHGLSRDGFSCLHGAVCCVASPLTASWERYIMSTHARRTLYRAEALSGQRKKLWELSPQMLCSVLDTCLSTAELRKVVAKYQGHDLKGLSDLAVHEEAVRGMTHHDKAGKFLHK